MVHMTVPGWTYAALCNDEDERALHLIKIGCTQNPEGRFRDDEREIIISHPDSLHGYDDKARFKWGELERRVLSFAGRFGLRYEDNDPEYVTDSHLKMHGSIELIKFDYDSIIELRECIDYADHDVKEFFEDLLMAHEQGLVYERPEY